MFQVAVKEFTKPSALWEPEDGWRASRPTARLQIWREMDPVRYSILKWLGLCSLSLGVVAGWLPEGMHGMHFQPGVGQELN